MADSNSSSGGIGFIGLLTIVLIVLKLTGLIAISWWWVFSPMIVAFSFTIAVVIVAGIVILFSRALK